MSSWLVDALTATTLLMVLVLAARGIVRRWFGASTAYALWLIPALRLVLPPLDLFPAAPLPTTGTATNIVLAATDAAGSGGWFLFAWALGAIGFAGWQIVAYRLFVRRALAGVTPVSGGSVATVATRHVAGPAATGLLVRLILVPRDFDTRFSAVERDLALRHERVHLARGDLWANAAALGVLSLHWFNPIAHRAYRAFREDQELSCDAVVIAGAGAEERAAYGAAMVKSAWATAPFTVCPMTRTTNLKRRLKMVRMHKKSMLASAGGTVVAGLLAIGGMALTATGGIAAEPTGKSTTLIVKHLKGAASASAANGEIEARCGSAATASLTEALSKQMGKPVKVQIVNCGGEQQTSAQRLAAAEKARAGVVGSGQLNDAERTKVLAALDETIAKLKTEQ